LQSSETLTVQQPRADWHAADCKSA
jgi:hypothetical protein